MGIISAGLTDIGRKRKSNQDSIYLNDEKSFFVVADGMGGHNGGDIASQMTVEYFNQSLANNKEEITKEFLLKNLAEINLRIFNHGSETPELKGMGTTVACLSFNKNEANILNVGDSRVYLIQNKKLYQLSKDHSLVQEKLNLGFYDREAAKNDPQKNILTKAVGHELTTTPDLFTYQVKKSDLFLICSDGLHGKVSDHTLLNIINSVSDFNQQSLKELAKKLIDKANENGGQDNISVILVFAH